MKMKIVNKLWIFVAGLTLLFSCTDNLDTFPEGGRFTEDQKRDIVEQMPERLAADINGLYSMQSEQFSVFGSTQGRADDFGYPMACLANDLNGSDMWSTDDSYNWFSVASSYEDRTYSYANPYIRWAIFYNQIKAANDILASIPDDTDVQTLLYYKGQALAVRAFDYFSLVQMFQFNYKGNEDKPAVPIVTFGMTDPNNPRARVDTLYTLIMKDLDEAIDLLEGYSRPNKAAVDQKVAYGIRARVNLVMQNWAAAAEDAAAARAGYSFLSRQDVSTPGFTDASSSSWMWALIINKVNITDNLACWPSKLSSFSGYGYTTAVGCYKGINNLLWARIPDTDVRKGWWINQNQESPLLEGLVWDDLQGQEIAKEAITDIKLVFPPYTNVKFGADGEIGNADNASDWVMMRAEEMLLVQAEGLAMSGNVPQAKSLLENFVQTYRDPEYECVASTPEQMQNEIWYQRRVELWGEGFAFNDLMRLNKNMVRFKAGVTSNFPDAFKFNVAADNAWRLLRIPQREISSNTGIPESANNAGGTLPLGGDGAGLTDGVIN